MKRLIDHRECGGSGCRRCENTGTEMVEAVTAVAFLHRAADAEQHKVARECCPCYQGISVNEGVAQCTHADHRCAGEWCAMEDCPLPIATTQS